jgi:hypothetical protein
MKNGKPNSMEERLERLEADVKEIKTLLQTQQAAKEPWWKPFVGMFANDPVAEEVRKITDAIRAKERRKARRKTARKKKQTVGG